MCLNRHIPIILFFFNENELIIRSKQNENNINKTL